MRDNYYYYAISDKVIKIYTGFNFLALAMDFYQLCLLLEQLRCKIDFSVCYSLNNVLIEKAI